jgi:phospholipid/cholesterol/gamma-HCH transport system substrate-binding protein
MTREIKVGIFVICGLITGMLAVFLIGTTRDLWERQVSYMTAFRDVAGLKPGAPVRMGGLDIGTVTNVGNGPDVQDTRIFVKMSITAKEAQRIRADTVARVVNKGLLGDKMVELSVGSPNQPSLNPGSLVPSEEPGEVFSALNRVAAAAQSAIEKLQPLAQSLGDPAFARDIKGSASNVDAILDAIVRGDGVAHRFFFDKTEADRVSELLARLDDTSARLNTVLDDVQDVSDHVRQGPGIVHALVYDGEISKSAGGAVKELHEDLRAIREGNGLAHALLYGDDSSQHVMSNLNAMSDDLRAIVGDIRQGKGTLGALIVDPTLYEDVRSVVSNVERNEVLRALVRYSIKADEQKADSATKSQ